MDEIFGVIDGRFRVSIVDSTMMWIVHHAMDKAHERVRSREGVIERLHEISKFYELAVMQLDGCVKFVQQETDNHYLDSSHEEVLEGLAEIRNRLNRRLHESELALVQKDRELAERSESEFKLRQALEMRERELVSSQEDLEIAKTLNAENSILERQESVDDDGDGESCELKNSVSRQVRILEKFEFDYEPEDKRNQCIDDEKVEELGSDIDILKETLDITFGKMHNAIFFSELGPIEQQIKSEMENDVMSIFLNGFVKDFQEELAAEAGRKEKQISIALKSDLMNEITSLCEDTSITSHLDSGSNSRKTEENQFQVDREKSRAKTNEDEPEDEGSHHVAKMIKNHESIIRRKSAEAEELNRLRQEMLREKTFFSSRRGKNSASLKGRIQEALQKLENSIILNAEVNKTSGENGEIYVEENTLPEEKEKFLTEIDGEKSDVDTLAEVWEKMQRLQDEETIEIQKEICKLRQEGEEKEFQNEMIEEIPFTIFKGLIEKFRDDLKWWELENQISDGMLREFIKIMFNQQNEVLESDKIEAQIKDDIYHIVLNDAMKEDCSIYDFALPKLQNGNDGSHCMEGSTSDNDDKISQSLECEIKRELYGIPLVAMLKQWQESIEEYTTESLLREEIYWFVLVETIKSISCKANQYIGSKFFDDFLQDSPIMIKEDIYSIFLKEMVKEWNEEIEAVNVEISIREEIYNTVLNEAQKEVSNFCTEVNTIIQESVTRKKTSTKGPYEGLDINEEKLLLSESIGEEENLILSSGSGTELEKTTEQFDKSKAVVGELRSRLETLVPKKVLQITPVEDDIPERNLFLFNPTESQNVQLQQPDSKCTEVVEILHSFDDFKLTANEKLEAIMLRLEGMKHTLAPFARDHASLREKESLYKKAFIIRCENLRKAENEVDLLGDQVDILLSLLGKIYLILSHHSPVLQQYFDVSKILGLIKKEVAGVVKIPHGK